MLGININCKEHPFCTWILDGWKTIETRETPSLDPYIGKRIGLIETGRGQAMLVGYATITARYRYYNQSAWDNHYHLHRVPSDSKYDFKGIKYGYELSDVESCEPRYIYSKGIVARQI